MTSIITTSTTASTAAETSRGDADRVDADRVDADRVDADKVWTDQVVTDRLLAAITGQQHRILGILDGLDEQTLRRPVLPSGWSCLGMVQHLTGMTWFWFVEVMAGRLGEHPVGDSFEVPGDLPAAQVLDACRTRIPIANAAVQHLPLSTEPAWWPEGVFGDWRLHSLAEVLTHVVVETSCHTGHLDVVRELIDGRTWSWQHGRLL